MSRSRMLVFACAVASFQFALGLILVRPHHIYEKLIQGVHDHYNNTCIILLHGASDPVATEGLEQSDGLLKLQMYLSSRLSIRTAIMDFHMFKLRVGKTYHHIKRPLFVLLNDFEEVKQQFGELSTWITMAYPTWLIFLRDDTRPQDFFADIYVPFDCNMIVSQKDAASGAETLTDVYQIYPEDRLRWMSFGGWDPTHGFEAPTLGLYQRRSDLDGYNIRVVSVHDPPVSLILKSPQDEPIGIKGFFGELLILLQEGMNCTFSFKEAVTWGVELPNGTWTGSIKMLLDGEADLAATELMMTSDRLNAIQYTTPVYTTKCRTYIKRPSSAAVKWDAYLAPFDSHLWNAILVLIVVSSVTIVLINSSSRGNSSDTSRLSEVVFYVFGAFCSQGMEPSLLDPVRIVHLIVHLTAVVVLAAYSAALISFLAIKTFMMPFTTMSGLLNDGTYRFAVIGDSADYSFFQNTSDKVLRVMFDELLTKEVNLPTNYLDGLKRVCKEEKYAFMTMDNMASVLQEKVDCFLEPLDVMMQTTVAMAVPPNSHYRGIINSNILLLKDSGILQRLLKSEWSIHINRGSSGWTSVELEDVTPLLLFLLGAIFLTCLLLLVEHLVHRRLSSRKVPVDAAFLAKLRLKF